MRTEIADLDAARRQFVDAIDTVPTEALTHVSSGDDYALGGLVTHVNAVLRRYGRILDQIVAGAEGEVDAHQIDADMARENDHAIQGLTSETRGPAMALLSELHEHVLTGLSPLDDDAWSRKTPVLFAGGDGTAYPTSPADIAGWLTGHYLEHVPHVRELHQNWEASRRRS